MFGFLSDSWSTGFGLSQKGLLLKLGPQSFEVDWTLLRTNHESLTSRLIETDITFTRGKKMYLRWQIKETTHNTGTK